MTKAGRKIRLAVLATVLTLDLSIAPSSSSFGATGKRVIPDDVHAFVTRRVECDHLRGEDPYNEKRAKQLDKLLVRACRGTDAELGRLRSRYRHVRSIISMLKPYDAQVE